MQMPSYVLAELVGGFDFAAHACQLGRSLANDPTRRSTDAASPIQASNNRSSVAKTRGATGSTASQLSIIET
jgi:hypothetical protein